MHKNLPLCSELNEIEHENFLNFTLKLNRNSSQSFNMVRYKTPVDERFMSPKMLSRYPILNLSMDKYACLVQYIKVMHIENHYCLSFNRQSIIYGKQANWEQNSCMVSLKVLPHAFWILFPH